MKKKCACSFLLSSRKIFGSEKTEWPKCADQVVNETLVKSKAARPGLGSGWDTNTGNSIPRRTPRSWPDLWQNKQPERNLTTNTGKWLSNEKNIGLKHAPFDDKNILFENAGVDLITKNVKNVQDGMHFFDLILFFLNMPKWIQLPKTSKMCCKMIVLENWPRVATNGQRV